MECRAGKAADDSPDHHITNPIHPALPTLKWPVYWIVTVVGVTAVAFAA